MTDLVPPWAQPAGEGHRRRRAEDRTAVWRCVGKPSETVGRKATELRRRGRTGSPALCPPGRTAQTVGNGRTQS